MASISLVILHVCAIVLCINCALITWEAHCENKRTQLINDRAQAINDETERLIHQTQAKLESLENLNRYLEFYRAQHVKQAENEVE